jgi:hypothetical protein
MAAAVQAVRQHRTAILPKEEIMFTNYDKALAPLIVMIIGFLNQQFGWQFSTDPATVAGVIGAIMVIVTYIVPNKPKEG